MIIAVKSTTKKKIITKFLSIAAVVILCIYYYNHMSSEYSEQQKLENEKKLQQIKNEEDGKSSKLERLIYREIESAVDLIGQRKVIDVKIVSSRALLVVDPDTNLDALKVRYGSAALIKKGVKDIKNCNRFKVCYRE